MRRFQALLIAAGLATAPTGAVAGPSKDSRGQPPQTTVEKFEWSMSKGRLGVMVLGLTPELRKHFGTAADRGVLVARVEADTPAEKAGIAVGDVIVGVRGRTIDGAADVLSAIADAAKGQTVAVEVVRDGRSMSLQVTMTDEPAPRAFDARWSSPEWLRELLKPFDRSGRGAALLSRGPTYAPSAAAQAPRSSHSSAVERSPVSSAIGRRRPASNASRYPCSTEGRVPVTAAIAAGDQPSRWSAVMRCGLPFRIRAGSERTR
jgi:membrane-associated protease RseP (regulator of RpoE activity)